MYTGYCQMLDFPGAEKIVYKHEDSNVFSLVTLF